MSAIFQRPLCDMGAAYDFALRPLLGDPDVGSGGGCDDRPRRVEILSAETDPRAESPVWRSFSLCPEHESQLRQHDAKLQARGTASRFRSAAASVAGPSGARR